MVFVAGSLCSGACWTPLITKGGKLMGEMGLACFMTDHVGGYDYSLRAIAVLFKQNDLYDFPLS